MRGVGGVSVGTGAGGQNQKTKDSKVPGPENQKNKGNAKTKKQNFGRHGPCLRGDMGSEVCLFCFFCVFLGCFGFLGRVPLESLVFWFRVCRWGGVE